MLPTSTVLAKNRRNFFLLRVRPQAGHLPSCRRRPEAVYQRSTNGSRLRSPSQGVGPTTFRNRQRLVRLTL